MDKVVMSSTLYLRVTAQAAAGPWRKACQALDTKVGMTTLAMDKRGSMNAVMPETMISGMAKPVMPLVMPANTHTSAAQAHSAGESSGREMKAAGEMINPQWGPDVPQERSKATPDSRGCW